MGSDCVLSFNIMKSRLEKSMCVSVAAHVVPINIIF